MFVLSFKNGNNDSSINSFYKSDMPLVDVVIDNKPFFDQPGKSKQEAYEKLIKMSRNDDYTTGNVLDYLHQ